MGSLRYGQQESLLRNDKGETLLATLIPDLAKVNVNGVSMDTSTPHPSSIKVDLENKLRVTRGEELGDR